MVMDSKMFIDPSEFSEPESAVDLYSNAIRKALPFKGRLESADQVVAKVLSPPLPLNPGQAAVFNDPASILGADSPRPPVRMIVERADDDGNDFDLQVVTRTLSKFTFFGRIEKIHGGLLPEPCPITYAVDPSSAYMLIRQHIQFISMEDTTEFPAVGDLVNVRLEEGTAGKWDLQTGHYVGIKDRRSVQPPFLPTSAAEVFDNKNSSLTTIGSLGSTGPQGQVEADALRCFIQGLGGTTEKHGTQLSSGGDLTPDMALAAAMLFQVISKELPHITYQGSRIPQGIEITAGNDSWHAAHSTKLSRHRKGIGIDFVLTPRARVTPDSGKTWPKQKEDRPTAPPSYLNNKAVVDVGRILSRFAAFDSKFKFLDEYNYPSPWASGPHFHFTYGKDHWESGELRRISEAYIDSRSSEENAADIAYWEATKEAVSAKLDRCRAAGPDAVASAAATSSEEEV